ncbi:UNVERIFIED_ORG: hypothetical protein ABIC97_000608 [Peribacillus simplex]
MLTVTEGASPKKTLETNLSGKRTTMGRNSGERFYKMPPKRKTLFSIELNSHLKGQRRECCHYSFLSFFALCGSHSI